MLRHCLAAFLFTGLAFPCTRAGLIHRYDFNDPAGSTQLHDRVGTAHGTLVGANLIFRDGQLDFPGTAVPGLDGYVTLPIGIISSLTNVSFEVWVTWRGPSTTIQKFIEFGNGGAPTAPAANGATYTFLAPNTFTGQTAFTVAITGLSEPQSYAATARMETDHEVHLIGVYDYTAAAIRLYRDGQLAGSGGAPFPLRAIADTDNWIGRSHFSGSEPNFNGTMNEFRIYDHALTDQEVQDSYSAGPHRLGIELGKLEELNFQIETNMLQGRQHQARLIGKFSKQSNVDLTDDPYTTYFSSAGDVAQINSTGKITATGAGRATLTAAYRGTEKTADLHVLDRHPALLLHRYDFSGHLRDTTGGADGLLNGSGSFINSQFQLESGSILLPPRLISTSTELTIEAWFTQKIPETGSPIPEQHLFDFGSSTKGANQRPVVQSSFYFSPFSADGTPEFGVIAPGKSNPEPRLSGPALLAEGEHHVAITYGTNLAKLYLDSELTASAPITTPLQQLQDTSNFLGAANGDLPAFIGQFNELRIYRGILTASQIADHFRTGPDALPNDEPLRITSSQFVPPNLRLQVQTAFPTWKHRLRYAISPNFSDSQLRGDLNFEKQSDGSLQVVIPNPSPPNFFQVLFDEP